IPFPAPAEPNVALGRFRHSPRGVQALLIPVHRMAIMSSPAGPRVTAYQGEASGGREWVSMNSSPAIAALMSQSSSYTVAKLDSFAVSSSHGRSGRAKRFSVGRNYL